MDRASRSARLRRAGRVGFSLPAHRWLGVRATDLGCDERAETALQQLIRIGDMTSTRCRGCRCHRNAERPSRDARSSRRRTHRTEHRAHRRARALPRAFRGWIARPTNSLSTLRSPGRPRTTHDSVPGGGQPFPGGTGYLRDLFCCSPAGSAAACSRSPRATGATRCNTSTCNSSAPPIPSVRSRSASSADIATETRTAGPDCRRRGPPNG